MRTNEISCGPRTSRNYESGTLREVTGTAIRPGGLFLTERALDFSSFPAGAALLDVGCGAGGTVEYLVGRHGFAASGVDISPILVAEGLRRNPRLPLAEGAAESLPAGDGSQDGVFCECVLSLVREPRRALAEFHRVLRPGGGLVLSDLYSREERAGTALHCGAVPRETLEGTLAQEGFTVLLWEDHTFLLKELVARLILADGSLEAFCDFGVIGGSPGYYLLVARRG